MGKLCPYANIRKDMSTGQISEIMRKKFFKKAGKKLLTLLMAGSLFLGALPMSARAEESSPFDPDDGTIYHTEVINNVSIDDINIHLAQYEIDYDGQEIPLRYSRLVVPGAYASQIARVTNIARPAWIRIKPEFEWDEGLVGVGEELFIFANDNWKKCGDYYYYLYPVATGETIEFIKEVYIPKEWGNETSNKHFGIFLRADAVQVENFTPDFNSDEPWFGTMIEICQHHEYEIPTREQIGSYSVVFRNGAEGLVRLGDDWFTGFERLMPGDVVNASAEIANNYVQPVDIWFWTENVVENVEDDELLNALRLTIQSEDEIIFSGTLNELRKPIKLGTYNKGDRTALMWTLEVPPELTNRYAMTATKTKWIFEAQLTGVAPNFKTGDDTIILPFIIGGGASLGIMLFALIILITKKRKERKNEA